MWRRLWERWKVVAKVIGDVQARVILGLVYFGLVAPVALVRRIVADPLDLRGKGSRASYWTPRVARDHTLDTAREQ